MALWNWWDGFKRFVYDMLLLNETGKDEGKKMGM